MRRSWEAIAVCGFAALAVGCNSGHEPSSDTVAAASRQAEAVSPPPSAPAPNFLVASGPVTMEQQLDVVAQRAGVVSSLEVDVDSAVRSGQLLAQLDDRQLSDERSAADYTVKSLEADLKNWEAEVQVRKTDLERAEQMREAGINTQEALDHAKYDLTATQFEVERQNGELESAEASLKALDVELEKTRIVAPFNGEVSQRYVRLDQYVRVGDRLFQVTGNSPLEVRFTLPAREGVTLRRGSELTVAATPEFRSTAPAAVTHLSPVVDPGSGTIEVTAVLSRQLPGLLPGMVASVRIPRSQ